MNSSTRLTADVPSVEALRQAVNDVAKFDAGESKVYFIRLWHIISGYR